MNFGLRINLRIKVVLVVYGLYDKYVFFVSIKSEVIDIVAQVLFLFLGNRLEMQLVEVENVDCIFIFMLNSLGTMWTACGTFVPVPIKISLQIQSKVARIRFDALTFSVTVTDVLTFDFADPTIIRQVIFFTN